MKTITARPTFDDCLEGDLAEAVSREIAAEIDYEVLKSVMDWKFEHVFEHLPAPYDDIKAWCKATFNNGFISNNRCWLFKEEKDMQWFILRWGT